MSGVMGTDLRSILAGHLQEEIDSLANDLIAGHIEKIETYREVVGKIWGLRRAEELADEAHDRMMRG